jgi:flavin reductase (DIM6/NTAB) family NADH-FMN oxidoreductase RutF
MTIHSSHPFADPESERDAVRRLRGRLGGTVSLWTTGTGPDRAGLTVSSLMIANGDPAHALALVDPDSDFAAAIQDTGTAVVQLLEWPHRDLAEAFAGLAPAPGGVFTLGSWDDTAWGPRLDGTSAWAGVRLGAEPVEVGWSLLLDTNLEHVEIGEEARPLVHRRGRYVRPD